MLLFLYHQSKLKSGQYTQVQQFAADMRLIWANAIKFNMEDDIVHIAAVELSRTFEKEFADVISKLPTKKGTLGLLEFSLRSLAAVCSSR